MRAAVVSQFGGPEQVEVVADVVEPVIVTENQVLVDVNSSGVNPVDTYIRNGTYSYRPELPYIVGRDGAGIVKKTGSEVQHVKIGDRVWFFDPPTGSAAETTVVLGSKTFLLPENVSFEEGSCLGIPYLTAYRALHTRGHLKTTDRVLIHGASGGVGIAACQLAKNLGAALVVGTAGSVQGLQLVKSNGADEVVNHREEGYEDQLKQLSPQGFDLIIEMLANVNLPKVLPLLALHGKVGIVGCRGQCTIDPRMIMSQEREVFGVMLSSATAAEFWESSMAINDVFIKTAFRPVIKKIYQLEEIAEAHREVIEQTGGATGNLVVKVRD